MSVEDVEKAMLQEALEKARGNVSEAARLLKVTRNTLRYRMGKYNLTGLTNPRRGGVHPALREQFPIP